MILKAYNKYVMKFKKNIIQWNFLLPAYLPASQPASQPACLMPSGKRNSITAKAMGLLIFSLFDVALSRDVPFGIPQYVQCMHHGLTFVLLCVPFLFADSLKCRFAVARCMVSLQYVCKWESSVFSVVTGLIAETILTLFFVGNEV